MRPIATIAAVLAASPALAHDGLHLHPHGIDGAWALLAGTIAAVVAGAVLCRAKK